MSANRSLRSYTWRRGRPAIRSRNFPFLGPESAYAAEAAEAAAAQGKYWEYRDLLFHRQQGENQGAFSPDNLRRYAVEAGLDMSAFDAALAKGTYRPLIVADLKEAESKGIRGVPTFFINGKKVDGVPSVEKLGELIDQETGGAG